MPKWLIAVIVVVVAVGLVAGGAAFAAYRTSRAEVPVAAWSGGWPMGARGFAGPMMGARAGFVQGGIMHEFRFDALADTLGLTVEDLTARLQDGETLAVIAESQGLTLDELADAQAGAFEQAIQSAVDSGELTQEQADWILAHHAAGPFFGAPPFGMMGGRGLIGDWMGPRGWRQFREIPVP